eukprot:TRINITY_DN1145_c0_g2_i2.p1 TRINITY_DN1145_c0_g2~~TRINITY_DN1145_c0_g2_i2.p1  ORF type:complete len:410 (+),score=73.14 TRINITY_DN1145_c0_g2_i2:41-1270(+)
MLLFLAKMIVSFCSFRGIDCGVPRPKTKMAVKAVVAISLTILCMIMLQHSTHVSHSRQGITKHEEGIQHVLVTGGAGYIGSHAALRLLEDGYMVTIVDNLSRGNIGAVHVLEKLFPQPNRLQFIYVDLGDKSSVEEIFRTNSFDAVIHFAAVAYVGESMEDPLRYYHNITSNTLTILEAMAASKVSKLIYSSTCATYGEPDTMPIKEDTPQAPINPYGKAKKMAEEIIKDYAKSSELGVTILRYFNVIGSDPEGRLGESPRPELRHHGRISGACFDAAMGIIPGLQIKGTDYDTKDGTCVRDYIHVTDLVDAHVKALNKTQLGHVDVYNVGTGTGSTVKEFVEACKVATGVNINVTTLERRPGDYAEVYSDPSKIWRELGWSAKYTNLTESLAHAWRWRRSHPVGYASY